MDTSTTVLEILTYMPAFRVKIITNSMPVMESVYRDENIDLYMAPGLYRSVGGPLDYATAEYLSRFHYNKAFLVLPVMSQILARLQQRRLKQL